MIYVHYGYAVAIVFALIFALVLALAHWLRAEDVIEQAGELHRKILDLEEELRRPGPSTRAVVDVRASTDPAPNAFFDLYRQEKGWADPVIERHRIIAENYARNHHRQIAMMERAEAIARAEGIPLEEAWARVSAERVEEYLGGDPARPPAAD